MLNDKAAANLRASYRVFVASIRLGSVVMSPRPDWDASIVRAGDAGLGECRHSGVAGQRGARQQDCYARA